MEPVGLGAKSPDVLGTLSQFLGIKGQLQGLAGQAAEVAGAQQTQRQRQGLGAFDIQKHRNPDGTFNLESAIVDPELRAAAGDQYVPYIQSLASANQSILESKNKLLSLTNAQRESLNGIVGALVGDKDIAEDSDEGRKKLNSAMIEFGKVNPDSLDMIASYSNQIRQVPRGGLQTALKFFQRQNMDASQQRQATLPQFANTGGELTNINPDVAPNAPTRIPLTLSPGEQDTVSVDQLGNPYRVQRTPRGAIAATTALPGAGGGAPATFGVGERGTLEAQADQNFKNVTANRQAASMAPQQLDQINKALKLSRETATGSFAAKRADIESAIGSLLPTGFQGLDDASKLNELEKLTERIATDASTVLGVNARTDAERESIRKQNANIGYTPQAIQNVLQYAKAQTMAMQAKGDAQEKWLKREGSGITKQHEFETEFRQAYDPKVFQLAVMTPAEREKSLAKMSSAEVSALKESGRRLKELGVTISGR